jgi:hypothetical protein
MTGSGPPEFGTLAWALASGGNLSARERRRLLTPILRTTVAYTVGRLRRAIGLRPGRRATLDLERLRWPDSRLASHAERACHETLSTAMANHSLRTFVFGLALSELDGKAVDLEELYVCSLLHDLALEAPTPGRCFAVVGAERARALLLAAGADAEMAERIAEGIALHISPGIGFERGPLAPLVAGGALIDLAGLRLEELSPELVAGAFARWPRAGCKRQLAGCWRREARAVPQGRAAATERYALFSLVVRLAPFAE